MDRLTFAATASIDGNTLSGVAHVFGQRTMVHGRWVEFATGSFDDALAKSDVRAFVNHDTTLLLGRQSNGTVSLTADRVGLNYAIDLPDTSYARDLKVMVERGDLTEMSFGIFPGKTRRTTASDGVGVILHTAVKDIFDISPVSLPAFGGTSAALHSASIDGETVRSQLIRARARARSMGVVR